MTLEALPKNALDRLEWVMTDSRHATAVTDMAPNPALKILLADEPEDPARDAQITELRLYAPATDRLKQIPSRVRQLKRLECLAMGPSVDPALVASIDETSVPPGVTALGVFTSGAAATWPRAVSLPHVIDLRTDGPLTFAHENFPNLQAVSLEPTRNGKNLDAALACQGLRELQLLSVPGHEVFQKSRHLPLAKLGLLGGKLETLQGIEALSQVEWLRLHNLRSLRSISAVKALTHLQELEIRYCKKIEDIACLADLPNLRRLQVLACGDLGLSRIKPFLEKLDQVMISASA
ncbi:hypothetical protein OOT46_03615 [Aquabacterium sp. A7-Y]|uniref:hypothetical protein n=1 Tax=Aquabacterium sp. A7-Y TaxID=1349605 RepID=UPI00223DA06A|nr:hypothetical protein [Aquabacterium sp. A7-Y]MCW7536940.1 hypothetical protein [Aquabacterium sp. A7-Y]